MPCTALRLVPHVAALFSLQLQLPAMTKGLDALPCLARTSGALQPATSRAMRSRAAGTFDATFASKINVAIIIIMQPLYLCRRTPFMISSLHVTKVMMLNMIMTTRRGCGSLCNLYASAVGHLS